MDNDTRIASLLLKSLSMPPSASNQGRILSARQVASQTRLAATLRDIYLHDRENSELQSLLTNHQEAIKRSSPKDAIYADPSYWQPHSTSLNNEIIDNDADSEPEGPLSPQKRASAPVVTLTQRRRPVPHHPRPLPPAAPPAPPRGPAPGFVSVAPQWSLGGRTTRVSQRTTIVDEKDALYPVTPSEAALSRSRQRLSASFQSPERSFFDQYVREEAEPISLSPVRSRSVSVPLAKQHALTGVISHAPRQLVESAVDRRDLAPQPPRARAGAPPLGSSLRRAPVRDRDPHAPDIEARLLVSMSLPETRFTRVPSGRMVPLAKQQR